MKTLNQSYENLGQLLFKEPCARQYFDSLSPSVQEEMEQRADSIHTKAAFYSLAFDLNVADNLQNDCQNS